MPKQSPPATMEFQFLPLKGIILSEMQAGHHPDLLGHDVTLGLLFMYGAIPDPPVYTAAPLASAAAARDPKDGVDRISRLPDQILKNVVSRLPAKDAARTDALASRWRGLWRFAPLTVVDAHILPDCIPHELLVPGGDTIASKTVVAAASGVLAAHRGPFRCFQITGCHMASYQAEATRWLELLAAKDVQRLVFFNRPWPLDFPLPAAIFSCVSVTHLHLGAWRLPDTAALPRYTRFPHVRELVLSLILMRDHDLAFFVERSPVLEKLTVIGWQFEVRLRLVSPSLRCLQLGMGILANLAVVDAPCLERLLIWMPMPQPQDERSRIKIGHAPNLRMLGFWQPGIHELEIGSTVIKASTRVSPSTIVPSVRILALEVEFEVRNDVKMVPCFLKCFPNVEKLHVYSQIAHEPTTGKLNFKLWQEAGPIECVQSHVKKFVFQQFRGTRSELMFLKFIAEGAQILKKMVIVVDGECFSSDDEIRATLKLLTLVKWASKDCKLIVLKYPATEELLSPFWCFRTASDSSCMDPFDLCPDAELSGCYVFHNSSTL